MRESLSEIGLEFQQRNAQTYNKYMRLWFGGECLCVCVAAYVRTWAHNI